MTNSRSDSKPTSGIKSTFRSLRYRNFRLYFSGQSISLIGTWIQRIAIPWLVYDLTGSVFMLGLIGFVGQIPVFLLAPFAGVLTDRYNRYYMLIMTQVLAMIQALILATLVYTGAIQIWHIIILSALLGCVNAFDSPTRQSLVVKMVDDKADLGNAIALNSSMVNSARLLGPSIAGVLIAVAGEGLCFLINGLSYLVVIGTLLFMRIDKPEPRQQKSHVLQDLKSGFSYAFNFPPIRSILMLMSTVSLMGMSYMVLMPAFAKGVLHGTSHTFGFLMGASGLGALSGALYLASRKSVLGLGRLLPIAATTFGVSLILMSFSRVFLLAAFFMVFTGAGMMLLMASSNTILQTIVEEDKRGRIMSFYTMAFIGTMPFGSFLAGSLAKVVGTPWTMAIGGFMCITGAVVFGRKLPHLKKIVHPIYVRLGIIPEVYPEPPEGSTTN